MLMTLKTLMIGGRIRQLFREKPLLQDGEILQLNVLKKLLYYIIKNIDYILYR